MEHQNLLSWTTKEFEHYEKGAGWYMTLGIVGFMLIVYEIYLHDYIAALTLFIGLAAIYYYAKQLPREVQASITEKGIQINNTFHSYKELRRFWIVDLGEIKQLHIETTAYLNRFIVLLISDLDPETVAGILREFLPETEANQETVAQKIARHLRF